MPSSSFPGRWPVGLRNLSALLLGLVVALGMAELLTRLFAPHPRYPEFAVSDERVGCLPRPGARGRATNMFGEFDTAIQINREGFRDRDHPVAKPPNTFRIAFIGDSFTYAEQVEEKNSFVRRTETLLNGRRGVGSREEGSREEGRRDVRWNTPASNPPTLQVECLNFGVGGYDTYQEVLCYETFVRKYHSDLVVLAMYVHNDLLGNSFYMTDNGFGRPYFRLVNGALEKVSADRVLLEKNDRENDRRSGVRWYHHFQFYNVVRQLFWEIRMQGRHNKEITALKNGTGEKDFEKIWRQGIYWNYRYYAGEGTDPVVVEANTLTRLLLKKLESMVQQDGGQFCVAMLPAAENLWPEQWPQRVKLLPALEGMPMDFGRPFKCVKSYLPEMEARGDLLDLRPALHAAAAQKPIFFHRDNHYNSHGQEAVAQALVPWLEPKVK